MKDIKYILYARKSTEGEDRQIESIQNQLEVLRELADRLEIKVVKELTDSKSAKTPFQRTGFDEMLALIRQGKASGILCYQINRLSRNPAESGLLQQMLQDEQIQIIQTSDKRYLSNDNAVIFSVEASIGNQFIIDLRKNVKRGIAHKMKHGGLSGPAPQGYLNYTKDDVKLVKKDPFRHPLVRKVFDLFLTGDYTVPELRKIMNEDWGYRTAKKKRSGDNPISRSAVYHMLKNPRYAGQIPDPHEMGVFYKANYPPMITLEEYDEVQELLGKRGCPRLISKRTFALRGFIKCGECGCMITAEKKKKKLASGLVNYHTYYHCTGKKPCSQKGSIREKDLEDQLYALLNSYELTPKLYEWGIKALNEVAKTEMVERNDIQAVQFKSLASIQAKLDKLLDLVESGIITTDQYKQRSDKWAKELEARQREQANTAERARNWYELVGKTLELLTDANEKFTKGEVNDKKEILLSIGQNPVLIDKKLLITPNEWLLPVKEMLPGMRAEINKVITEPDMIGIESNNEVMKIWCRV